eukprot:TRINITY_DN1803_c0_g1_i4.p1 TRINITY_DN1803_c0_g1~~TRINITY_DN1803_c0_g1_i4.p1  ORF type:complete len:116 (-),score=43.92 TRINITY_DN1803_c0_g1_i4:136-483(-)
MEQMEMEMIKKLQHTQDVQRLAYEELENALSLPPEEFSKKYQVKEKNKNKSGIHQKTSREMEDYDSRTTRLQNSGKAISLSNSNGKLQLSSVRSPNGDTKVNVDKEKKGEEADDK